MSEVFTGNREQITLFILGQTDADKLWDITEHKEKKTLSQNGYYWKLCNMVAAKLSKEGETAASIHNKNLIDLRYAEWVDGSLMCMFLPDTEETEKVVKYATTYHLCPTSEVNVGEDGIVRRKYVMLRGCHTFNTLEMSKLLDKMIQEAEAQGISTITSNELAHMRELEQKNERRMENYT